MMVGGCVAPRSTHLACLLYVMGGEVIMGLRGGGSCLASSFDGRFRVWVRLGGETGRAVLAPHRLLPKS